MLFGAIYYTAGLLPSRLHHLSAKELQARFQKLRDFARQRSSIPWFVFALIMRLSQI